MSEDKSGVREIVSQSCGDKVPAAFEPALIQLPPSKPMPRKMTEGLIPGYPPGAKEFYDQGTLSERLFAGGAKLDPNKKICILGCADSKNQAPYDDKTWEIWGVNNLYGDPICRRYTRWFEIHHIHFDGMIWYRRGSTEFRGRAVNDYLNDLANLNVPVYMQRPWPRIPKSVQYPIIKVTNLFGRYFTNTVSYMLALAIMERPVEISIFGVDMAVGTEWHHQRPSCELIIGMAMGLGIKVWIPDEADLLKTRFMYGFEELAIEVHKAKIQKMLQEMEKRKNDAAMKAQMENNRVQQYNGAQAALMEWQKIWGISEI